LMRTDPQVPSPLDVMLVPSSVALPIELPSIAPVALAKIWLFRCFRGFPMVAVQRCLPKLARSLIPLPLRQLLGSVDIVVRHSGQNFRDPCPESRRRARDEDFPDPSTVRSTDGIRCSCAQETLRGCPPTAANYR
jgi:hypothetical protein